MKKLIFILLLQFLVPVIGYTQANFFKGYMVTNTSDTIKGYVQLREREFNPQFLRFKKELSSESQLVTISESKGYGTDIGTEYERHYVEISMSNIKRDISTGIDTTKKNDVVFLRVINKGKNVSLFSFKDEIKERFYIQENTDVVPVELSRQLFYADQNNSQLITQSKYRNQLLMMMMKYGVDESEERKVERLSYAESDLLRMVVLINHQEQVKPQNQATRFYIGAALTAGSIKYSQRYPYITPKTKNELSVGPLIKAGFDVFANPATGNMLFRGEVAILRSKLSTVDKSGKGSLTYAAHSFTQTSIVFTPQIIQSVYNDQLTKVFVGLGLDINVPFYSKKVVEWRYNNSPSSYFLDENSFDDVYISIPIVAGVSLNKKLEMSLGYSLPKNIFLKRSYTLEMDRYRLGFSYFLGKR